jgi:hypothetical protein
MLPPESFMPEPHVSGPVHPAPRRVLDGLLSATFHRPYWVAWGFGSPSDLDELRSALAPCGIRLAPAGHAALPVSVLPRDIVVLCPADQADTVPAHLEAAQFVCVGDVAAPRRGDINAESLEHLISLLTRNAEVATTSTYHEI